MIQTTSLEAYDIIITDLGKRQQEIYGVIEQYENVSNLDISRILNIPINSVTPRVKELRDLGFVEYSITKKDRITKRSVMCWKIC